MSADTAALDAAIAAQEAAGGGASDVPTGAAAGGIPQPQVTSRVSRATEATLAAAAAARGGSVARPAPAARPKPAPEPDPEPLTDEQLAELAEVARAKAGLGVTALEERCAKLEKDVLELKRVLLRSGHQAR